MKGKEKLTNKEIEVLRGMVLNICQRCDEHELICGKLQPHRLQRGNNGGKYSPHNLLLLCKECHKMLHENEWSNVKGK